MTVRSETIWELPVPCSLLAQAPKLMRGRHRRYSLILAWESETGDRIDIAKLRFAGVESYRVTHLWSLTREMIQTGYGRLVELTASDWARESMKVSLGRPPGLELRHVRVCFDDGPCYEFLCTDCQVEIAQK